MPVDTVAPQGAATPIPSPSGTAVVTPTAAPFTPAPPITTTQPLTGTALAQTQARHHLHHAHAQKGKKRHAPPTVAAVVQLAFVGANAQPHIVGVDALPGTDNYLLGRQRAQWHTRVPTYAQIAYQGVYPGIDLVYHGRQGHLEYDWRLAPRAAVDRIRLAVRGATGLHLDSRGALVIGTRGGVVRQDAPLAYQEVAGARRPVAARYVLLGLRRVGLALGAYDHGQPLVIDPVLSYASYLGGSDVDQATGIAVDGSGNIYVAGNALSTNFPTTTGAYSTTFAGGTSTGDAFVSKLSADGSTLLYSTYLGGSGDEDVSHIAVDGAGEAEIVGYTNSTNYPTVNAAQGAYGGGVYNAFASKLSADGSALVYSTYLGGKGDDEAYGLAMDSAGDAYVAGLTSSTNFPLKNALQGAFTGVYDAFVTELDPNGALLYSTYLGGSGDDDAYGIAIDGAGDAYVTGVTTSTNFPVSATAYQRQYKGGCSGGTCSYNAFVAKIITGGTGLLYSTYLGGSGGYLSGGDEAEAIAVDGAGNAWITGQTDSTNFPTTGNAVQKTNNGNPDVAFVAELNADGSALPYATYLGGSGDNGSYGIALDSANNVYIAGETSSTDFPTVHATQAAYGGGAYNAFVSELTAAGGALAFSTYLGGSGDDAAFGIAVAPDDSVEVAGLTSSTNFPTVNPLQAANAGNYDAFVASYGAPASTCPSPWLCADSGNPPFAGDQTLTNGTWTIHGSGADIWNASDQFHFVWQGVSGDSSIVARLTSQQNTSICTKAGIMYRASTDPADVNYSVVMLPDCHFSTSSVQVNARSAVSTTATTANDTPTALPVYLKATRTGSTFTAYTSSDGVTWTPIPNSGVSLPNMPNTALVGLVVCSQNNTTTSQATFDHVSLSGSADLTQLDTDTAHYTQTVGLSSTSANLQLFNAPVGSLAGGAWTPRDTTLSPVTGTGMLAPAQVPFGLQIAQASGGPTLASLTTEDGVTVGLGLAPGAASATPVTGRVNLNAVTYPSLTFPVVAAPTATATITATPPPTSTPGNAAGGVNVYVGYADSLRPNPNLPVPWQGAPNTAFVGHADSGGVYDSGAIRLDNTTAATVTIKDATVVLHTVNNDGTGGPASGQTFDLWGANTVAPNGSLILAATGPGDNFDTSDFPLAGTSCTSPAGPTTNPPRITLTFGDNSQATITDTAHVLDTGRYDTVTCPGGNESLQWRALGTTGVAQASGQLTLAAQTAPQIAGLPYAEIATLTDASNQAQPNVAVNFGVASGPNAGLTGQAFTDSQGHATFTYTGTVAGTDTITASLTNASGGVVTATPVTVTWAPLPVGDLSLQAIPSGLDVRVVLQNATSRGPFTLALAPDPSTNTQLVQDADGSIRAIQPITTYGDDGVAPVAITQTEYTVQPPSATDSNADPATLVNGGPVTPTLISTTGITQYVTLNVDPTWLNDSRRVFPVTLDLPIMTADGAANTDVFGTASSCVPNATIPQAVVVGTENGCTYNGQVSFDLSSLPAGASIVSATLNMYTPNQTGPTGVQVLQNAPHPVTAPW